MEARQQATNAETTEQLARVQKSWSINIPRRTGIVVLALIKIVLSLGLLVMLLYAMLMYNLFGHPILFYHIIIWIIITLDVADIVTALGVIIGVYVKNRRIMKTYYYYSICVFGAITFLCCVIVFTSSMSLVALLICLFTFFLVFMIQEFLSQLLKREALKLEGSEQLRI